MVAKVETTGDPKTMKEATGRRDWPEWREAAKREYDHDPLMANDTRDLVKRPEGVTLLNGLWFLAIKQMKYRNETKAPSSGLYRLTSELNVRHFPQVGPLCRPSSTSSLPLLTGPYSQSYIALSSLSWFTLQHTFITSIASFGMTSESDKHTTRKMVSSQLSYSTRTILDMLPLHAYIGDQPELMGLSIMLVHSSTMSNLTPIGQKNQRLPDKLQYWDQDRTPLFQPLVGNG
jgi:hypothetical protein